MSFISGYITKLKDYAWTVGVDKLKTSIVGSIKSQLSAVLPQFEALAGQSDASNSALLEIFHLVQEHIPDECFDGDAFEIYKGELMDRAHDVEIGTLEELDEAIDEYFKTVGTLNEQTQLYELSLTEACGGLFKLAYSRTVDTYGLITTKIINLQSETLEQIDILKFEFMSQWETGKLALRNAWSNFQGRWVSCVDALGQLKENIMLNETIQLLIQQITSLGDKFTLTDTILPTEFEKFLSVRQFWSVVKRGWAANGIIGVISAILYSYSAASHLVEDINGNLVFTDNFKLMPLSFATGIIKQVLSNITQAISTIALVIGNVIGKVIGVIGSMISSLVANIDFSWDQNTTAALVDSFNVGYPISPHGLGSHEWTDNNQSLITKYVNEGIHKVYTPGGVTVFSCTNNASTNSLNLYRMEFHPDLVDRRGLLKRYIYPIAASSGQYKFYIKWPTNAKDLVHDIQDWIPPDTSIKNNDNGVLPIYDDQVLREILLCNMMLYTMYKLSLEGSGIPYTYDDTTHRYVTKIGVFFGTSTQQVFRVLDNSEVPHETTAASWDNPLGKYFRVLFNIMKAMIVSESSADPLHFMPAMDASSYGLGDWTKIAELAEASASNYSDYVTHVFAPINADTGYPFFTINYKLKADWYDVSEGTWTYTRFGVMPQKVGQFSDFAVKTPKYERSTFWSGLVLIAVGAAVMATTAIVISIAAKKAISKANAKRARAVENSWGAYLDDPSSANYNAYRKAVKKNNRMNNLFGGTDYSTDGLWASADQSASLVNSNMFDKLVGDEESLNVNSLRIIQGLISGTDEEDS